jgi:hypothetical protein
MSTYKVLQDIEAEDKFLGPLTLKQCIFAAIAVVSGYLSFVIASKGGWIVLFLLVPIIIVTGFLAFPWGRDQPTEVWLLAKIRFMFKPRKRIWDQTGMQELVKITAPPKVVQYTSDNLSQTEVKSRLKALADTIDTRGWAIKGTANPGAFGGTDESDRLVGASTLPAVSNELEQPSTDMFDSPLAAQISSQISANTAQHKSSTTATMQEIIANPKAAAANDNFWFMNQPSVVSPGQASFSTQTTAAPADETLSPLFSSQAAQLDPTDAAFLDEVKSKRARDNQSFSNHRRLDPNALSQSQTPNPPVTATPPPATIELARNDDRTVDSIAREAGGGEVVVPLH